MTINSRETKNSLDRLEPDSVAHAYKLITTQGIRRAMILKVSLV